MPSEEPNDASPFPKLDAATEAAWEQARSTRMTLKTSAQARRDNAFRERHEATAAERARKASAGKGAAGGPKPLNGRAASTRSGAPRPTRRETIEAIDSMNKALAKLTAPENFREGSKASAKGSLDLALSHFREAVSRSPSNLQYRKTLRATACRKHRHNLVGSSSAPSVIIRLVVLIAEARRKKEWSRMDRLAEEGLALNPWHDELHASAAEACLERRYFEVATFLADTARQLTPGNAQYSALYDRVQTAMRKEAAAQLAKSIATEATTPGKKKSPKKAVKSSATAKTAERTTVPTKKATKVAKRVKKS